MNIFEILKMRPTNAHSAAAAVFRTSGPAAPPVPVTNVNTLFSRAQSAHGVIDPAVDNSGYPFGMNGGAVSGFGALAGRGGFSGFGGGLLFSKFSFNSQCAQPAMMIPASDFQFMKSGGNSGPYFRDIDYEAPDAETLQKAGIGYDYLVREKKNGNLRAEVELDLLESTLKNAMTQVDSIADHKDSSRNCDDPHARPWQQQAQLYSALSVVVDAVDKFASAPGRIPAAALINAGGGAGAGGGSGGGGGGGGGGSATDNVMASLLAKAQREADQARAAAEAQKMQQEMEDRLEQQLAQQKGASTATSKGLPPWAMPVGVLAAVGIAAMFILKKKKKS